MIKSTKHKVVFP